MERPGEPITLVRIAPSSRRPALLLAALLAAVAVAVVKPWGDASPRPAPAPLPAAARATAATATAVASGQATAGAPRRPAGPPSRATPARGPFDAPLDAPADATVDEGGLPVCYTPDGWRLVTDEVVGGRSARSWIPVTASVGAPAGDTPLPGARVVSGSVTGLGFCVPAALRGAGTWQATLWGARSDPAGAPAGQLTQLATLTAPPRAGGAVATRGPASRPGWLPGHYIMEVQGPGPRAPPLAFGIDLVAPARGGATAAAAP